MNYIHDIPYKSDKSTTSDFVYNAVIEISNGDNIKYEVHPDGEYLTAVRALNPIFRYPFSYGYIPQTLAEDGDGLDVIVVTPEPLAHLSVIEVRVLGYVPTIDNGQVDTKIIAIPVYSTLKRAGMDKVLAFLRNYKYPDNDSTEVMDFVPNISETYKIIEDTHNKYEASRTPIDDVVVLGDTDDAAGTIVVNNVTITDSEIVKNQAVSVQAAEEIENEVETELDVKVEDKRNKKRERRSDWGWFN